jgi:hypothetical protein
VLCRSANRIAALHFTIIDFDAIEYYSYDFESNECEGDCGDDKKSECREAVSQYYYLLYKKTEFGEQVCYPTVYLQGIESSSTNRRFHYSIFVDPADTCYNSTLLDSEPVCDGWYEDDAVFKANDDPPCQDRCIFAQLVGDTNLFGGEGGFSKLDKSIELVFGSRSSVGLICSIAKSVSVDDKNLPGRCCLDAPYQTTSVWGQPVSLQGISHTVTRYYRLLCLLPISFVLGLAS